MPIPSPFHERTMPLCKSYRWKDWAGFCAVCSYEISHEQEYHAFRQSAGLLDVTPLYKYDVHGKDAQRLLRRMMVKDPVKLAVGRVSYCCWCTDAGKVVDDGTVSRLDEDYYRVTAADPTYHWLSRLGHGLEVSIEDRSRALGALALQGPLSREILRKASDADMDSLKFFQIRRARIDDLEVWISRTGYSGDLGYEIWVDAHQGPRLWDALISAGKNYGLLPCGLDALDMARIEAGFIMADVDYHSALKVTLDSRMSSPYEIGLGWTVSLERDPFIGQAALRAERDRGPAWKLVGLEASWEELEALYRSYGLPPRIPAQASREPLPLYFEGAQVGRVTSHTWSPLLKRSIALASVRAPYAELGTALQLEHTVEFERRTVTATVVPTPFFDPERKRRP